MVTLTLFSAPSLKTDRDAFIASTGCIPGENRTLQENALNLTRLALEMQQLCATLKAPDGSPVVMRIGLHCGPVVGGIVGGNMIRYHLFGSTLDAVNQVRGRGSPYTPQYPSICGQVFGAGQALIWHTGRLPSPSQVHGSPLVNFSAAVCVGEPESRTMREHPRPDRPCEHDPA